MAVRITCYLTRLWLRHLESDSASSGEQPRNDTRNETSLADQALQSLSSSTPKPFFEHVHGRQPQPEHSTRCNGPVLKTVIFLPMVFDRRSRDVLHDGVTCRILP